MEIKQVYQFVNTATAEALGKEGIVSEDLSNVVDVGTAILDANAADAYVQSLVNQIGRIIFVDRAYRGGVPSVLMDGWEFGSVLEKIQGEIPEAVEDESWELEHMQSYDQNIFYQPKVTAKFFNKKVVFEIDVSFTKKQVMQSFQSATQLNAFLSMIYNNVEKSMTVKTEALIMRTINNAIAETVYSEYSTAQYTRSSGVRAVNLLYLYNQRYNTSLTASDALTTPDFIRFASFMIKLYIERMSRLSSLFNVGGKDRFTPSDLMRVVMLADFEASAGTYLYDANGQFLVGDLKLPEAETVPYWQGSGTSYAFSDITNVDVTTASGHSVDIDGVLCVLFDRDALGVSNLDREVTTHYNAKARFFTNFYHFDAGYFNDLDENFVVFFVK